MCPDGDANILIHPRRGKKEKKLPEIGLLLVNPSEATACHRRFRQNGGEARFLFNSDLTLAGDARYFVAGPAIGAPMAVLCLEKLIALGAKRIILFGWCGAISESLKVGDILLPTLAKSGEGTSRYYPLSGPPVPAGHFRDYIAKIYEHNYISVHPGCVWSTDAVYREDRRMLQALSLRDQVVAVDMEFSALCTVACFRHIEFVAVLVVSDELWGHNWRPGFSTARFLQQKEKALGILLETLASQDS
jgi:uridine phosphorylase